MKIAYIGPTGIFGGVRIIAEHLNRLAARGHDCTLVYTGDKPITWLSCNFAQRPTTDAGDGYEVTVGTAMDTWPAAQAGADAVGGRAVGLMQMAEWLFYPVGSAPYVATKERFAQSRLEIMAISEWLARLAEQTQTAKIHRIRNGIDANLFYPQRFDNVPEDGRLRVLVEGYNHSPAKDWRGWSHAAIREARYKHGLEFEAWGFSQYPPQFEFDKFWQQPQQHVIRRIYSSCDVFLKASEYEGRPGPDMEAMACGAVVVRAIGEGGDDLNADNSLSTTYGKGIMDYDAFKEMFIGALTRPDIRASLREAGLRYVREKYDWEGAIDGVELALTGSVTRPDTSKRQAAWDYDLSAYNALQAEIVGWETPQAMFLGGWLRDNLKPTSVIDIGCGPGTYLIPFKPEARVLGVDGAPEAGRALEPGEFVRADLRQDWRPVHFESYGTVAGEEFGTRAPAHFDLSLCIETGEHLPPDRADYLVGLLASCSAVCFWSAAQPGQGGTLHLNEQPREWWLEKFKARGWEVHPMNDALQDAIATNEHCKRVQWLIGNSMLLRRTA